MKYLKEPSQRAARWIRRTMVGPMDGWTAGSEGQRDVCAGRRCKGLRGNRVSRISELINYGKTRMSLQVPGLYRCGCNGEFEFEHSE